MRYITHQLPVLLLALPVFFRIFLQAQAHVFVIPVQVSDFPLDIRLQDIVEIPLLNPAHRHIQLIDRIEYPLVNPPGQHQPGKNQNQENCHKHVHQQLPGYQGIHLRNHKGTPPGAVGEQEIRLLHIFIHVVKVKAGILRPLLPVRGKPGKYSLRRIPVPGVVQLILPPDDDVRSLPDNLGIHRLQVFPVRQPGRILRNLPLQVQEHPVGGVHHLTHVLRHRRIIQILNRESVLNIHQVQPDPAECQRRQHQRQGDDSHKGDPQSGSEFHGPTPPAFTLFLQ